MSCPHCTHLSNNYGKLKAHIGKVHFPVPVTCADCGKVCKNKYAMQVHKSKYHRRTWKGVPSAPPVRSPVGWSLQPAGGGLGSPLTLGEAPGPVLATDSAPLETQQNMDVPSPSAGLDLTRKPALGPGKS
ncbi:hypothetical protein FJT64_016128 [Amphibalanus amphitrite]|uniref:C2H2-type domain-containing protein n=1 Tax=Amphibalanus amphitrite TaxID=1232801 RepID=A0A6A4XAP3_AMPAM|nr:hypothetical protein FJT64_016128 [Amphibalanus amphitrite]